VTRNVLGARKDFSFRTKNALNFPQESTFGVITSTISSSALNVRTDFSGVIQTYPARESQQPLLSLIVITIWLMMRLNACTVLTSSLLLPHHKYAIREWIIVKIIMPLEVALNAEFFWVTF
jgi:hypothetical protein